MLDIYRVLGLDPKSHSEMVMGAPKEALLGERRHY